MEIQKNKWYHLIVTLSSNGLKIFLNLEQQPTTESFNTNYMSTKESCELKIGQYPDINFDLLQSFKDSLINLDNLVIWNKALSEKERKTIYFAELGKRFS